MDSAELSSDDLDNLTFMVLASMSDSDFDSTRTKEDILDYLKGVNDVTATLYDIQNDYVSEDHAEQLAFHQRAYDQIANNVKKVLREKRINTYSQLVDALDHWSM